MTATIRINTQIISESTPSTLVGPTGKRERTVERLAHRVERAGADVAIDDAERPQRESEDLSATQGRVAVGMGRGGVHREGRRAGAGPP